MCIQCLIAIFTPNKYLSLAGKDPSPVNLLKQCYKKYLHAFENFYRKLGCAMLNTSSTTSRTSRPTRGERWRQGDNGGKKKKNPNEPDKKDEEVHDKKSNDSTQEKVEDKSEKHVAEEREVEKKEEVKEQAPVNEATKRLRKGGRPTKKQQDSPSPPAGEWM